MPFNSPSPQTQSAPSPGPNTRAKLPCAGTRAFKGLRCMPRCLNCRLEVEASLSRIGGRQLRKLRAMPECSAERCAAFLRSVPEDAMRLHMASMAWWRFSSAGDGASGPVLRVLRQCTAKEPGSGADYMHRALRTLSPLSQAQLSTWFGCDNLYQAAALFMGDRPPRMGRHCPKCSLYKQGCDAYDRLLADSCPLWNDRFVQGVAAVIRRDGGTWHDPCSRVDGEGKETA